MGTNTLTEDDLKVLAEFGKQYDETALAVCVDEVAKALGVDNDDGKLDKVAYRLAQEGFLSTAAGNYDITEAGRGLLSKWRTGRGLH